MITPLRLLFFAMIWGLIASPFWTLPARAGMQDASRYLLRKDYARALEEFESLAKAGLAQAQYMTALMYVDGLGMERNSTVAAEWFLKAAEQGHTLSQFRLAILHFDGIGVEKNLSESYFWAALSQLRLTGAQEGAAKGIALASASLLPPDQLSAARARMESWRPKRSERKARSDNWDRLLSFGTGFFISFDGHLMTNEHVVSHCERIVVVHDGKSGGGTVADIDYFSDLAVVRTDIKPRGSVKISSGARPRLGDPIQFFSYASPRSRSQAPVRTEGKIVNRDQYNGHTAWMETSAPTFPGQSGSPLLDASGRLVGVVRGTAANEGATSKGTIGGFGAIAAGIDVVVKFLRQSKTPYEPVPSNAEAVAQPDRPLFMARLECWGN